MIDTTIIVYLIIINVVAFFMYGIDKIKAIVGKWRVSEISLILVAALGGAAGALLGIKIWHHKTNKLIFQVMVPLLFIIWVALFLKFFEYI